jgi:uncharacterized protein (DUF433 family)
MKPFTVKERITMSLDVMLGKPVVRGTRIPVYLIVQLVDAGMNSSQIIGDYPLLSEADIEAAITFSEDEKQRTEVRPLHKRCPDSCSTRISPRKLPDFSAMIPQRIALKPMG